MKSSRWFKTLNFNYFLCLIFLTIFLYFFHVAFIPVNSDSAILIPMAKDILKGNYLLNGWYISTNSYYFTDILEIAALLKLKFSAHTILYGWSSFLYALLLIVLYHYTVRHCLETNKRDLLIGLLPVASILLVPLTNAGISLMSVCIHITTYLMCILCWTIAITYLKDGNKLILGLYLIIATLGNFSDGMFRMVLFAPVCLSALINIWRKDGIQKSISLIIVNILAFFISSLALKLLVQDGYTFQVPGIVIALSTPSMWIGRISATIKQLLNLYGYMKVPLNELSYLHFYNFFIILYLFLNLTGVVYYSQRFKRNSVAVNILVTVSFLNILACIVTQVEIVNRYFVPFLLFSVPLWIKFFDEILLTKYKESYSLQIKIICCTLGVAILLFKSSYLITCVRTNYEQEVAQYLKTENLLGGYGTFWAAARISAETDYSIPIYQVFIPKGNSTIQPFNWLSNKYWCNEKNIDFVIIKHTSRDDEPVNSDNLDLSTMFNILGNPKTYKKIGPYDIYEYGYDISQHMVKTNYNLLNGWYGQEGWGTWAKGKKQIIQIRTPKNHGTFSLWLKCFQKPLLVNIYANGQQVAKVSVTSNQPTRFDIQVNNIINSDGKIELKLVDEGVLISPKEVGMNMDTRKLGLAITKIVFDDQVLYGK